MIEQSLFEPLPWEGRWATALVFDGNVGIGGDPVRLLARSREVIAVDGQILVEVEPPGPGGIASPPGSSATANGAIPSPGPWSEPTLSRRWPRRPDWG